MTDRENFDYLYGGWLEIAGTDERGLFEKINYAVKCWRVDENGGVAPDLPLCYSSYVDDHLFVTRLDFTYDDDIVGTEGTVFGVSDLLSRAAVPLGPVENLSVWAPRFVCHLVLVGGEFRVLIDFGAPELMQVEHLPDGKRAFTYHRDLIDRIRGLQDGGPARPFGRRFTS